MKNNLKRLLKERGLTQIAFIDMIRQKTGRVFQPYRISRYVNNKVSFITSDSLQAMSRTLGVTIDQILENPENESI